VWASRCFSKRMHKDANIKGTRHPSTHPNRAAVSRLAKEWKKVACGVTTFSRVFPTLAERPRLMPKKGWRATSPRSSTSDASCLDLYWLRYYVVEEPYVHSSSSSEIHQHSIDIMPGWEEATAIQKSSLNTYTGVLHDDWCIGSGKQPQ
jgi:hypothetical protein